MLFEILPDPRALVAPSGEVSVQVLQIHRAIPERVPIGHFEPDGREVVDEIVSRTNYLEWIQRACAARGDGLEIRFYDHFDEGFDASVLDSLHEIHRLSIDGLPYLHHPEAVGRLPKLTSLRFGPRQVGDSRILCALGVDRLTHFTLAGTPTPAIDLAPLAEARSLRSLRLLGHGKNTEAIAQVTSLSELPDTQPDFARLRRASSRAASPPTSEASLNRRSLSRRSPRSGRRRTSTLRDPLTFLRSQNPPRSR